MERPIFGNGISWQQLVLNPVVVRVCLYFKGGECGDREREGKGRGDYHAKI